MHHRTVHKVTGKLLKSRPKFYHRFYDCWRSFSKNLFGVVTLMQIKGQNGI